MMAGARNHDCTIGAAAEHLGLSVDALRYYERAGVIPPAARDAGGRRRYGPEELHLLDVLIHLRDTGEFTRLVQQDPNGVPERLALLRDHREAIIERMARLALSLSVVDDKIADYSARLDADSTGEGR